MYSVVLTIPIIDSSRKPDKKTYADLRELNSSTERITLETQNNEVNFEEMEIKYRCKRKSQRLTFLPNFLPCHFI